MISGLGEPARQQGPQMRIIITTHGLLHLPNILSARGLVPEWIRELGELAAQLDALLPDDY